ncbi:alternative ribosome rescue aminoacyl-tRNA hydrolase ArfB [Mucilaginibacter terrae]|uniref:alternative ribosome rescue aminoacyl-tRNA hydrolase ArfB n=1 Tax=Mucilaginibacter terrae TaxID=1955052 RepID=UPI003643FEEB
MDFNKADLQKEVIYKTSRSGGKGGQNVNKVSTKVELLFNIQRSGLFTDEDKLLIINKLQNRLNKDGHLQVISEEERSQFLNKERAMDKLVSLLTQALHKPKARRATKVSKGVKAKRLDQKRMQSVKKQMRQGGKSED